MSLAFIQKCCPSIIFDCIRSFFVALNKSLGKKQKKQSNGLQQLQEQEFQFSAGTKLQQQQKQSKKQKLQMQKKAIEVEADENLTIKINFTSNYQDQQQMNLNQQQKQISLKLTNFNFKLNLELYDQYYSIIQQKTKNIKELFQINTKNILKKTSKSEINVEQIQTITGYRMIISYKLPCSYSFFKKITSNQQITTTLNNVINSQTTLETIHPNLTINYLSFKKFLILEPRYFHYLKYQNSTQNFHWEICTSIKGSAEVDQKQKQCQLTSISCFQQRKQGLIANTYLEVDLKSNIKANKVVLRVYQQLSSYIDQLYGYVKQNYHEQQI